MTGEEWLRDVWPEERAEIIRIAESRGWTVVLRDGPDSPGFNRECPSPGEVFVIRHECQLYLPDRGVYVGASIAVPLVGAGASQWAWLPTAKLVRDHLPQNPHLPKPSRAEVLAAIDGLASVLR